MRASPGASGAFLAGTGLEPRLSPLAERMKRACMESGGATSGAARITVHGHNVKTLLWTLNSPRTSASSRMLGTAAARKKSPRRWRSSYDTSP
jgi:hypothetical protein